MRALCPSNAKLKHLGRYPGMIPTVVCKPQVTPYIPPTSTFKLEASLWLSHTQPEMRTPLPGRLLDAKKLVVLHKYNTYTRLKTCVPFCNLFLPISSLPEALTGKHVKCAQQVSCLMDGPRSGSCMRARALPTKIISSANPLKYEPCSHSCLGFTVGSINQMQEWSIECPF